jgi:hypothetical protein
MRPVQLFSRLSLIAIATASLSAVPASANEDIIFVPGTGESAAAVYLDQATLASKSTATDTDIAEYGAQDTSGNTDDDADRAHNDHPARAGAARAADDMNKMADRLGDPDVQDGIATMAERMGDAMLRLPVGKFASAIEKARPGTVSRRVRDDATLADLAGRDAEYIPEMIGRESRTALKMMSGFSRAFASMMPEFEKMGREMESAMADIKVKRR